MVNFIQKNIKQFFLHRYMSQNVGLELPIGQGNEHVFSSSMLNWVLLMLEQ